MNNPSTMRQNIRMIQGRLTDIEMAKILKKSAQTYKSRSKDPYSMNLYEVCTLCSKLHISVDDFLMKELKIGG